jgi:hypothetical protein
MIPHIPRDIPHFLNQRRGPFLPCVTLAKPVIVALLDSLPLEANTPYEKVILSKFVLTTDSFP